MIHPARVQLVQQLLSENKFSQRRIARLAGVSRGSVSAIASGRRPEYVERPPAPDDEDWMPSGPITRCPKCGGRLKHATISFGQTLPPDVHLEATLWSRDADLMLAIGSSLVVTPAADLPRLAKERGAKLVIINRDPTPLDSIADAVLCGAIGELLSAIDASNSRLSAKCRA